MKFQTIYSVQILLFRIVMWKMLIYVYPLRPYNLDQYDIMVPCFVVKELESTCDDLSLSSLNSLWYCRLAIV